MSIVTCPDKDTLFQILSGTAEIETDTAAHIDTCEICLRRMEELSDSEVLDRFRFTARLHGEGAKSNQLEPPLNDGDLGSVAGLAIHEKIGSGGMGIVYRGYDAKLNRDVAVKLLRHDASGNSAARFEREARAAAGLNHPNVVPVYQCGQLTTGYPYLVMPLIKGQSLTGRLEQIDDQPLSIKQAVSIVEQVANGLDAAHQAGLIHRDVKPGNILLDDESQSAKLTDFGLVRHESDETLTRQDVVGGTPAYMSPERSDSSSDQDARGDVYSLGIVLYECLTGSVPFRGRPLEVLAQHCDLDPVEPIRLNKSVPRDLSVICMHAIAKDPSRRYQSAGEFANDLRNFTQGKPIVARPASNIEKMMRWGNRNRALALSLATLATVLLASTILSTFLWSRSEKNRILAENRAASLESSQTMMIEGQQKLGQALRANYLDRVAKGNFLELPIDVRNTIMTDIVRTWRLLFETRDNSNDELRQMVNDLLQTCEFAHENFMYSRAWEITQLNREIVDALLDRQPGQKSQDDMILAARVYNQIGATRVASKRDATGELKKAQKLSQDALLAIGDSSNSNNYQDAQLTLLNTRRLQVGLSSNDKAVAISTLNTLLGEIANFEKSDEMLFKWWNLEERILTDAAKRSAPIDAIELRTKRAELLEKIGEADGTDWRSERRQAVNLVNIGIARMRVGKLAEGRNELEQAVEDLRVLLSRNPLNQQCSADLHETLMIIANSHWQTRDQNKSPNEELAQFDRVIEALDRTLKLTKHDHQTYHRGAVIYAQIGSRYAEIEKFEQAGKYFDHSSRLGADALASLGGPQGDTQSVNIFQEQILNALRRAAECYQKADMEADREKATEKLDELENQWQL